MDAILRLELVLSILELRAKEFHGKAKMAPFADKFSRGHYSGWAVATEAAIDLLRPILDEMRQEAEQDQMDTAVDALAREEGEPA